MATKSDNSWIGWLIAGGIGLLLYSRVNAPDATGGATATNIGSSSAIQSDAAAASDLIYSDQPQHAGPDGLMTIDPTPTPADPRFLGPPIRDYKVGDTVTLDYGVAPPSDIPKGTRWWAPVTGAQPLSVTWTLVATGAYDPPIDPIYPRDVQGVSVGGGFLEDTGPWYPGPGGQVS
jgi:hypothetical protein